MVHRDFCSEDIFLVVEGQNFICSGLIHLLLFNSKAHVMSCSHTQNFTIKRTMKKTFASVFNEIRPILVTHFLGKKLWKMGKKIFSSLFRRSRRKREKKLQRLLLQIFLNYIQTQKNIQYKYQELHWKKMVLEISQFHKNISRENIWCW